MFVHGCFWHRHPECPKASIPKSRMNYWQEKFDANVKRDARAEAELESLGWRVATIWECESRSEDKLTLLLTNLFQKQASLKK